MTEIDIKVIELNNVKIELKNNIDDNELKNAILQSELRNIITELFKDVFANSNLINYLHKILREAIGQTLNLHDWYVIDEVYIEHKWYKRSEVRDSFCFLDLYDNMIKRPDRFKYKFISDDELNRKLNEIKHYDAIEKFIKDYYNITQQIKSTTNINTVSFTDEIVKRLIK